MYRAIYTAAAQQRVVGRIHYGIHPLCGDVTLHQGNERSAERDRVVHVSKYGCKKSGAETAADFAVQNLQPGGAFVAKVFAGGADRELLTLLKRHFSTVKHAKPPASRKGSPELYVIAQGFKGRQDGSEAEAE